MSQATRRLTDGRRLTRSEILELKVDDEGVREIVLGLARECHDFAATRDVTHLSVEEYLPFVFGELDGKLGDLFDVSDVPAVDTPDIATISIRFSDEGYRRLAEAAKDRVARSIDGDRDGV